MLESVKRRRFARDAVDPGGRFSFCRCISCVNCSLPSCCLAWFRGSADAFGGAFLCDRSDRRDAAWIGPKPVCASIADSARRGYARSKKSVESHSAIHVQSLPSNRAGLIGYQKKGCSGDLLRRLRPSLQNPLQNLLGYVSRRPPGNTPRGPGPVPETFAFPAHGPGTQRVHAHAFARALGSQRARQSNQAGLRCGVGAVQWKCGLRRNAHDVQDRAGAVRCTFPAAPAAKAEMARANSRRSLRPTRAAEIFSTGCTGP